MGKGLTLADLIELSKTNPKYQKLYTGLGIIDSQTQGFVKDIINDSVSDVDNYYIRTEIQNQCYSVLVFNSDKQATVGYSWPLATFLEKCSNKGLEMELNTRIKQILLKFEDKKLSTTRTNWVF